MKKGTLSDYLRAQQELGVDEEVVAIVNMLALASREVSTLLRQAALNDMLGATTSTNVQDEIQKPIDIAANEIFVGACRTLKSISWLVSEELEDEVVVSPSGRYAVLFDPLDGSSNLDTNVTVGSIFSVMPATGREDILQPGSNQVASGYAAYGPATMLVLTFGETVEIFVLDEQGEFRLSQRAVQIPLDASEYAINASRQNHWFPPVANYVAECVEGEDGPLGTASNMRWTGSMVADVHRILTKGGIFLYPSDRKTEQVGGRLRLLYEGSPMAKIVETAGGAATTGLQPLLEVQPAQVHQRVPVILGSRTMVKRLEQHYRMLDT